MATTIDDTPRTVHEGQAYSAIPEGEAPPRLPIDPHYYEEDTLIPFGPRLRWGGLFAGVVAAFAVIMLLSVLGIAIGLSTIDTSLLSNSDDIQSFTTTAGIWTGIIALFAYFVAGIVSTKVTDRPDGSALLHGTLSWMLLSMALSWVVTSGMASGFSNLPGGIFYRTGPGTSPADPRGLTEIEIAQRLGLTDPSQLMQPAFDEHMVSTLATTTNMSREEAQAALDNLRARVSSVKNDPDAVHNEIVSFLSQMLTRAQQQAPAVTTNAQRQLEKGSWMTFAIMVTTLLISIFGARVGIPSGNRWGKVAYRRYR